MHKQKYCRSEEEHLDDSHARSFNNKRRISREHDGAEPHKKTARNSQWVYGNLFECLSGDDNCPHGRIPFGGSLYCAWPLKDISANLSHKPPCLWDAE